MNQNQSSKQSSLIPALGVAGGILGNLIGNAGAKKRQEQANRDNIKFWNMQNEYNNPSAQMARLREAGLNPNLIYGTSPSSAVGNAGGVAPSKAAPYNMDNPLKDIASFADYSTKKATTDNLRVQNTVLVQEGLLKSAQTAKTLMEGKSAQVKAEIDKQLLKTSVDMQKENLRKLEIETIGKNLDNQFKSGAIKDQLKEIKYKAEYAKENLEGEKRNNVIKDLEIQLKILGIEKNDPWYFRIFGRNIEGLKNYKSDIFNYEHQNGN